MNESGAPPSVCYLIQLKGYLDPQWMHWFEGFRLNHESDGTSTLVGPVADQAELHSLLRKVRDVGIPLLLVRLIPTAQALEE